MATASRELARTRGAARARQAALVALSVAFLVIVGFGGVEAVRLAEDLDDRRATALFYRADPAETAGETASAYRRFRAEVDESTRFALVYGPGIDRNGRGFHRLFAGYYLYPAIAVDDPADAHAIMVFGTPRAVLLRAFERIAVLGGVWLGRRRTA